MKKIVFLFLMIALSASSYSQNKKQKANSETTFHRCGTQYVADELNKKHPQLKKERESNRKRITEQMLQNIQTLARTNLNYTIPVVVHIVTQNPSAITNAQVQSQIDVLNADYQGKNADSTRIPAAFKSSFGKSNIQFCLAKRDPNGEPTNGIVRIQSATQSEPGLEDPIKFTCKGGSNAWDPTKYLNIWVCDISGDFLGYSFSPSDPLEIIPLNERGFVNNYKHFGKGGTAEAPFNLGRTATHEIGHFFDLIHIWGPNNCDGGQNCGDSDEVGDTPNQEGCNFGAPSANQVITDDCTTSAPGIMWMNYMDYVDDLAMVMYTPQQYNRIQAAILATPWLLQMINSDGCNSPVLLNRDIRVDGLNDQAANACQPANAGPIFNCSNTFRPTLKITNVGNQTIQSLKIEARFGNGNPVITNWTGSLASQGQTTISLTPMTIISGLNSNLIIYSTEPNGQSDERTANDTVKLSGVVYPIGSDPLSQGFENTLFPPDRWQLIDEGGNSKWERTTSASKTGTASIFINNYDNSSNDDKDWIVSPLIPVAGKDSAFVTFQIAAATYSEPDLAGNPTDTLEILMTQDCGQTYKSIYKKWGVNLVTTGNFPTEDFFIPNNAQWRKDSIYLGDFSNTSSAPIQIAFRNTNNYENNIYLDDINIYTKGVNPLLKEKGILVTPNPFRSQVFVQFYPAPVNLEYMQIFSASGQLVWEKRISIGLSGNQTGPSSVTADLSSLQSGMYIMQLVYRNGTKKTHKLIKSR
jgi:hypothetical protein